MRFPQGFHAPPTIQADLGERKAKKDKLGIKQQINLYRKWKTKISNATSIVNIFIYLYYYTIIFNACDEFYNTLRENKMFTV